MRCSRCGLLTAHAADCSRCSRCSAPLTLHPSRCTPSNSHCTSRITACSSHGSLCSFLTLFTPCTAHCSVPTAHRSLRTLPSADLLIAHCGRAQDVQLQLDEQKATARAKEKKSISNMKVQTKPSSRLPFNNLCGFNVVLGAQKSALKRRWKCEITGSHACGK